MWIIFITKQAFTEEEQRQFRENVVEKCKESTHATDDEVSAMKMHEVPKTESAKCFAACILEKLGAVRINSSFTEITLIDALCLNFRFLMGKLWSMF